MIKGIFLAVLATAITGVLCLLWRTSQPYGDWTLLLFLPLTYILFTVQFGLVRQVHQARQPVIWQEHSWPKRLFSGGFGALLGASAFSVITIPLLVWQAVATKEERLLAIGLGLRWYDREAECQF